MRFAPDAAIRHRFAVRVVLLGLAFVGLLLPLQLAVGQWNRTQTRDWVFRQGGNVSSTPRIPDELAGWLPVDSRDWFWNFELIAFNDQSFDGDRLADLGRLPGLHTLRKLYLNGSGVDDAALAQLATWPALQELYLEDTVVSDSGLLSIERLPSLRIISLRNTRVTPAGVARLIQKLPRIEVLGSVNMRNGADSQQFEKQH